MACGRWAGGAAGAQGRGADALHKLVDDLYELSLADVGALSYRKTELDLREIIDHTAGAFGERLRSSGLALQLDLPAEPLPAFGDARRLRQLFANLFENSCRYTDRGGALRLQARREGRQMTIDLHDSAPAVPDEHLPRLFERFFRAEASASRRSGGAGLGLSICQRIAEAHEAASKPGCRRWAACGCVWNCRLWAETWGDDLGR